MAYVKQSEFVFDCVQCHTRCNGVSKGVYVFDDDAAFSETYEQAIIDYINSSTSYTAAKCDIHGYPDIKICNKQGDIHRYLEVKVQQRTFMHVGKYLAASNLRPSETVALNLSDLKRYFAIEAETKVQTVIVWVLLNRSCITRASKHQLYFQSSDVLQSIYHANKDTRTFKRKSGEGDIVDGIHKGVTVNFHFSLKELKQWSW